MIFRATADDLNCIRSIWYTEQLVCPRVGAPRAALGHELAARVLVGGINALLAAHGAFVVRPDGAPEDTVASFMVADLAAPTVHWICTKRRWRKQGLSLPLFALLDGKKDVGFSRYLTHAQRVGLEARGWVYRPEAAGESALLSRLMEAA